MVVWGESEMKKPLKGPAKELLIRKGVRRITFVALEPRKFPKYFTYRQRQDYVEDQIYRHLEPALAYQLEINRMKNFCIEVTGIRLFFLSTEANVIHRP